MMKMILNINEWKLLTLYRHNAAGEFIPPTYL